MGFLNKYYYYFIFFKIMMAGIIVKLDGESNKEKLKIKNVNENHFFIFSES